VTPGRITAGIRLALSTFTVVPVRADAPTREAAGVAIALAPAVGVLLGGLAAGVLLLIRLASSVSADTPLLAAVIAISTVALLTRGLHLDGLADTADGLGSMKPAAEARAVMRRSDIGPFGVCALLLVVLTQVAALAQAISAGRGSDAIVVAVVCGRLAATMSCTPATPAADATGLGATVAGTVRRGIAFAITGFVVLAAAGLGAVDDDGTAVSSAARCAAAVVIGLAIAHVIRHHAVRRLGGITGDVLGALIEVTTAVALVVMAL
jgi:adenosylcobinamide-GDP ribazoletransferase